MHIAGEEERDEYQAGHRVGDERAWVLDKKPQVGGAAQDAPHEVAHVPHQVDERDVDSLGQEFGRVRADRFYGGCKNWEDEGDAESEEDRQHDELELRPEHAERHVVRVFGGLVGGGGLVQVGAFERLVKKSVRVLGGHEAHPPHHGDARERHQAGGDVVHEHAVVFVGLFSSVSVADRQNRGDERYGRQDPRHGSPHHDGVGVDATKHVDDGHGAVSRETRRQRRHEHHGHDDGEEEPVVHADEHVQHAGERHDREHHGGHHEPDVEPAVVVDVLLDSRQVVVEERQGERRHRHHGGRVDLDKRGGVGEAVGVVGGGGKKTVPGPEKRYSHQRKGDVAESREPQPVERERQHHGVVGGDCRRRRHAGQFNGLGQTC